MTESKERDTKACFICKQTMIYRLKPASGNFAAKLQWQNPDGTAHYGFDGKAPFCKTNAPKVEKARQVGESVQTSNEIHLKDLNLEMEVLVEIQKETNKLLETQLARIFYIQEGLKQRGITPTGPFVGMLYNQQMEWLRTQ